MQLTAEQRRRVEDNMGLVGKVIKDKVYAPTGVFSYEDLFQIGCIGLCKAAATDNGGCFSTYAYRLIWNEICDALIRGTGDIIVFDHDGHLLVKRIAVAPRDRIDRRELAYTSSAPIPEWDDPILVVPEGCYFVLGDNSENSVDSRYWDDPFVLESDIVARIIVD